MKREFFLVCVILLAVCGFSFANRILFSGSGAKVEIAAIDRDSNKTILGTFDLSQNITYTVHSEAKAGSTSESINQLVIQDGKVWISEANCPNQDCVKQGKISMNGEMLVCLPHRLTVSIVE